MSRKIRILKSFEDVGPYIDFARRGADSDRNALGFLPPIAYRQAAEQGKLFVAIDTREAFLGHLMFGGVFPHGKVMQIFTVSEFREYGVAKALINELIKYVEKRHYLDLSAKVASDLIGANNFYERMGFHTVSTLSGGKTRKRLLFHRVRELDTPNLFDLMAPKDSTSIPSLGISGSYSAKTPIYAIDLNVVFDVSKQRANNKEAGMVLKAGFSNEIKIVITDEFVKELKRSTDKFTDDPYLQFALKMNVLPAPKIKDIDNIEKILAKIIFPEREKQRRLTTQDKSDLRHLSTAIHHKIAGFITSEKSILRVHDYLQSEYSLDVLGVSDFADAMPPDNDRIVPDRIAQARETELSSGTLSESNSQAARIFLKQQHVPEKTIQAALSKGDSIHSQNHIVVSGDSNIICFASWRLTQNPRTIANVFLCANEASTSVKTVVDFTLDQICRKASSNAPARIHLHMLPGRPVTKKIALAHGFRPEPGQEDCETALHKVAIGDVIDERSWKIIRRALRRLADVELPQYIPQYESPHQLIQIKTPSGSIEKIPLKELETLLSPTLIILPKMQGAIIPIRKVYADDLLGTSEQCSLLVPPEAILLKERVYYNTPRAASILAPSTLILFYESSKGGGCKSIVAAGRITNSYLLKNSKIGHESIRRGVLDLEGLRVIGSGKKKLITVFDNIIKFNKPVPLQKLREIGCVDGTNFITATRITYQQLKNIVQEGLNNE